MQPSISYYGKSALDEPPGLNESFEDIFDDAIGAEEGDADEDDSVENDDKSDAPSKKYRKGRAKSLIKSRWLVPIVKTAVVERPCM